MTGVMSLYVKMRDNFALVWFGAIDGLAVHILLGTSYVDRCIRNIRMIQRRAVPAQSKSVTSISMIKNEEYAQGVEALSVKQASKDRMKKGLIPDEIAKPIPVAK